LGDDWVLTKLFGQSLPVINKVLYLAELGMTMSGVLVY